MAICDFIGGLMAGVSGLVVGHPIDTVKVNQQVHHKRMMETIRTIIHHHGWRGFYSGMGVPLLSSGFHQSVFFGVYGTTMDILIQRRKEDWYARHKALEELERHNEIPPHPHEDDFEHRRNKAMKRAAYSRIKLHLKEEEHLKATYSDCFIAGSTAGFARLLSSCPMEVVKVRLQSQKEIIRYKGPYDCARQILDAQGIRGFFVGVVPLCGRAYGLGFYAVLYEYFKINIPISNLNTRMFIAGGTAGLLQWWTVIPLDVLKSRLQADDPIRPKYRGAVDCAKKMYYSEGFKSFYRGFVPLSIRAFPVNGATFLTYEIVFRLCEKLTDPNGGSHKEQTKAHYDVDYKYCK